MRNVCKSLFCSMLIPLILGAWLAACAAETPPASDPATAVATTQPAPTTAPTRTATSAAPAVPTEDVVATSAAATSAAATAVAAAATPPAAGGPVGEGRLPVSEEVSLALAAQYGGVPHALAVADGVAYLGAGPRLLLVDISDPARPALLGRTPLLPDTARDVAVANGVAFVAAGRSGLMTLDVTDPTQVTILDGGPAYAGGQPPAAEQVHLADGVAFVLDFSRQDGRTSLLRFDVADPARLTFVDALALNTNDTVTVAEGRIVVVGNGRVSLRDVHDPGRVLAETNLTSGAYASRAVLQAGVLTVAESGGPNGVEQFTLADDGTLNPLSDLLEVDFFFVDQMVTNGQTVFVAGTFGEFGFCDSQVYAVTLSGDRPGWTNFGPENCITGMALDGSRLMLAGRSGLQIYDVTDPAAPVRLSQFRHPDGFLAAEGVAERDGVSYVLTGEGRGASLLTLDFRGPAPVQLSDPLPVGSQVVQDLLVVDQTLLMPLWMGALNTVDIAAPAEPRWQHQAAEGELVAGDLYSLVTTGATAYMPVVDGVTVGGVGVIDLSDPANPTLVSVLETGNPMVLSQALAGNILAVLNQGETNRVHLYDISQPLTPQALGELTLPAPASKLALVGDVLYAACDQFNCQQLLGIDITDPTQPRLAGGWTLPFGVQELVVDPRGLVYLYALNDGLHVLDVTSPAEPRLTGRLSLPGDYARFKLVNGRLLAAAFDAGLLEITITR